MLCHFNWHRSSGLCKIRFINSGIEFLLKISVNIVDKQYTEQFYLDFEILQNSCPKFKGSPLIIIAVESLCNNHQHFVSPREVSLTQGLLVSYVSVTPLLSDPQVAQS